MLTINGEKKEHYGEVTIEEMLSREGFQKELVAVEKNGEIVPKEEYGQERLHAGDVVEVVSFMGGGC